MQVAAAAPRIQDTARALAALDVLSALADTASALNYTKPMVHAGDELIASDARHPVVERHVADAFVPNDVALDASDHQVVILTGPNMGGKSTYLRQTALLCLMAQAGSFVAARSAKVPIVDRLFARVGASDNLTRGQSTFMVEMQETANILHSATSRSLVILDEIGRGTATFDGLSLAWAVAEHLASGNRARPKTIFATHYHELTDLADALPSVANFHVVVREWKDDIVFLRKVVAGPLRSQLRHPGRQARRPPAVRRRSRPRDPQRAGARRAVARRTTVTERQRRAAAAAGSVPDAGCRGRRAACAAARGGRRQPDAPAGARASRGAQTRGGMMRTTRRGSWLLAAMLTLCSGCTEHRSPGDMIVVAMANAATNLDPRVGSDEASQKAHQLLYSTLVRIDEKLRVVSDLAEARAAGPGDIRRAPPARRAVPQRPGADVRGRRLHLPQLSGSDVSRSLRRVPAARVGERHRSIHGVVHAEGAVRLVSGEPGDGDRPGGFRSRERATADWHGPVPACGVRSGRSDRPQALPFGTMAARLPTPASF